MKFVVDCMLGTLAKWLRLMGYDTIYEGSASDDELVRIAAREGRVLLTKDNELAARRMLRGRHVFIRGERAAEQLRQVVRDLALPVDPEAFLTRCGICNEPIEEIGPEEVKGLVPPYVFATQKRFGRCSRCGKIYWRGTHVDHILAALGNEMP